jgi:hypothetical protein
MPLIIAEGLDVFLFESVESAELGLESTDVRSGIYKGFDAEGRALRIELGRAVPNETGGGVDAVRVRLAESEPTHAAELRGLLRAFLDDVGLRLGDVSVRIEATSEVTLEELVRLVARFVPRE